MTDVDTPVLWQLLADAMDACRDLLAGTGTPAVASRCGRALAAAHQLPLSCRDLAADVRAGALALVNQRHPDDVAAAADRLAGLLEQLSVGIVAADAEAIADVGRVSEPAPVDPQPLVAGERGLASAG